MARSMTSIGSTGIHVPVGGIAAWLAALLLALVSFATPALAADDPPGRVGRVTDSQGQSWFYDTEAGEWSSLERNRPITTGDRVAVDGNGRLELRIGSTAVRLAGGSELEIVRLDDDRVDLMLHSGSAAVRVRSVEVAREVELATADGRFSPRGVAHFRVDRRDDGSVGTAWSGDVHFEADDSALDVTSGRSAEFWREGANNSTHYSWGEPQHDDFADWTARADREDDRVAAAPYVSPEMTGAEDLNRYGTWDQHAEYGPVWYPTTVVAGWAPYRYGHWVVVRPWGWTWVDYAPWGFAPFHYGRWLYFGGRWCWAPGYRVARPVYSPAMVAWVGGPPAYGRGHSPYVGWVPLAPREPYYPHYTTGGSYWRAVNAAQSRMFAPDTPRRAPSGPTTYFNQAVSGAVSVVPGNALVPRRPIAPVVAEVDPTIRNSFATQPTTRVHVPPPGVARPVAVPGAAPGTQGAAPPLPPRATIQPTPQRSATPVPPMATAQPGAGANPGAPDGRRERFPRAVPAPPITHAPTAPSGTRQVPAPPSGNAPGNNTMPGAAPRVGLPMRPHGPAPAAPTAPTAPTAPPAAPAAQPQAPAVQQPAPTAPGPRRMEPGDPPAGSRRSGSMQQPQPAPTPAAPPQARAMPTPPSGRPMPAQPPAAAAMPAARPPERPMPAPPAAAPQPHPGGAPREARAPERPSGHAAPGAQARVRVPEWQGHPSREQMR